MKYRVKELKPHTLPDGKVLPGGTIHVVASDSRNSLIIIEYPNRLVFRKFSYNEPCKETLTLNIKNGKPNWYWCDYSSKHGRLIRNRSRNFGAVEKWILEALSNCCDFNTKYLYSTKPKTIISNPDLPF